MPSNHNLKQVHQIYAVYKALIDTDAENHKKRKAELKTLEAAVGEESFAKISSDEKALKRISDYIDSNSHLENKPPMPQNITADEVKIAQGIEKILESRQLQAQLANFFRWYDLDMPKTGEGAMSDYDHYKKEIRKAVDIYDTQGEEELIEYLKMQKWGVIHSGYDPKELILRTIRLHEPGPRAVSKTCIQISTAIEFHEQERNILQRLLSYMRQIDALSYMWPLIRVFIQLYEDNATQFKNWKQVKSDVELFLRELKHYGVEHEIPRLQSNAKAN